MQHPKGFNRLNSRAVDHLSFQKFLQGNKIKGTPQTVASVYVRETWRERSVLPLLVLQYRWLQWQGMKLEWSKKFLRLVLIPPIPWNTGRIINWMKNKHFFWLTRAGLLRNRCLHMEAVVNLIAIRDTGELSINTSGHVDMFFSINNGPKAATGHHSSCWSNLLGWEMGNNLCLPPSVFGAGSAPCVFTGMKVSWAQPFPSVTLTCILEQLNTCWASI